MSWKNIIRKVDAPLEQSNPRLKQLLQEIKNLKTEMNSATNANRRNNLNSQIQAKSQEAKAIQTQSNRRANWQNTLQNNPPPNAKSVVEETTQQTQQPQIQQPQQRTGPPPKKLTTEQLNQQAKLRRQANQQPPNQQETQQPPQRKSRNQIRQEQELANLQNRGKEQAQRENVARNEQAVQAQLPSNQRVVSGSNRDKLMEQIRIRQQRESQQMQAKQAKKDAKAQNRQAKKDAKAQAKQAKKDARKNPNIAPSRLAPKQSVLNNPNSRLVDSRSPQGQQVIADRDRLRPKQNPSVTLGGK